MLGILVAADEHFDVRFFLNFLLLNRHTEAFPYNFSDLDDSHLVAIGKLHILDQDLSEDVVEVRFFLPLSDSLKDLLEADFSLQYLEGKVAFHLYLLLFF